MADPLSHNPTLTLFPLFPLFLSDALAAPKRGVAVCELSLIYGLRSIGDLIVRYRIGLIVHG